MFNTYSYRQMCAVAFIASADMWPMATETETDEGRALSFLCLLLSLVSSVPLTADDYRIVALKDVLGT